MFNYSFTWKMLHSFTRRSAIGKLAARVSKLVEHASREFPGVDDFGITGELGLIRWLSRDWDQDSYVFDVGANEGNWTAMALSAGCKNIQIRAFEPDSRLIGDLSSRFAARGGGGGRQ
jgi:hypothetical protein